MFLPLRQLLLEVLQADPVCNFSPRLLNVSKQESLLHSVSMRQWNSADPSAYFKKSLPKSVPVDCNHRLSTQCMHAAKEQATHFYAHLDAMGVKMELFHFLFQFHWLAAGGAPSVASVPTGSPGKSGRGFRVEPASSDPASDTRALDDRWSVALQLLGWLDRGLPSPQPQKTGPRGLSSSRNESTSAMALA